MNLRGIVVTFLVSQSAWLLMHAVTSWSLMENTPALLGIGSLIVAFFAGLFYVFLPPVSEDDKGILRRNWFYYMHCIFAWYCTLSFILFLEVKGIVHGYLDFYLEGGEPYYKTSFGIWIAFWDATVQFTMYLIIIYKYDNRQCYRSIGLYWLGSMVSSMFTITFGSLVGTYGSSVHAGAFFNIPYLLLPICSFKHLLQLKPVQKQSQNEQKAPNRALLTGILIIGTIIIFSFHFVRGLAVLGSPLPLVRYYIAEYEPYILEPVKFGAMHCLFNLIYCLPAHIIAIYAYFNSNVPWVRDLSLLLSGAATQGTFTYMLPAFDSATPEEYRIRNNVEIVVLLNLAPVLISHLLLFCCSGNKSKMNKQQ